MPFFHGSSGVNIHGSDFKDIVGGNTTNNTTTTNSNNDSSVETGPTRNIYTSHAHSGHKYSANFVKGADQDEYYRQQPPTESGYKAHDRYSPEDRLARQKIEAALRRSMKPRSAYNAYGIYNQGDNEEEYAWQPSNAQPRGSFSHAQSAPVTQSSPFPEPSPYQQDEMARRKARDALWMSNDWPRSDPYEMRDDQDANSWSSSTAQPQPSFARARSNPFPVARLSPLEASPSPLTPTEQQHSPTLPQPPAPADGYVDPNSAIAPPPAHYSPPYGAVPNCYPMGYPAIASQAHAHPPHMYYPAGSASPQQPQPAPPPAQYQYGYPAAAPNTEHQQQPPQGTLPPAPSQQQASHCGSATGSPIPDAWHQTQFSESPDSEHSMGYLSLSPPDYWNSTPQHLTTYITADEAYAHITNKELEIRYALTHVGYEGGYSLHAGFNEELIHVGRQQEEIYVILDSAVSSNIVSIFEAITSPFPGIIYTPDETHLIPTDTPKLLPIGNGIRAVLGKQMALGASQPTTSISDTGGGGASSGSGGNGKGQGREDGEGGRRGNDGDNDRGRGGRGRRDNGGGDSDGDGGDGDGGESGDGGGAAPTVDDGLRLISIQFSSTLSSGPVEDQQQLPVNFKTASGIDIMINENRKGDSPPTGFKFPGPWFGVDMTLLDVATHNSSADVSKYTLSLADVRITASLCPTGIIDCSPGPMHAEEDTAKAKTEWNAAGGAWATFSATPNLRLGASVGRTVGVERTQRRYEILMHHLDESDSSVHAGEYSRGIVWKYAHNGGGGVFERVAAERFQPKPAVVFGLDRLPHHPMPLLEVEVVVYWSLCGTSSRSTGHGRQYLFPFLRSKKLGEAGIPVFLNFLHHVSVAVDLGTMEQGKSWVADGATVDKTTTKGLVAAGGPVCFQPIHRTAKKGGLLGGVVESDCKIVIKRALAGHVAPLTEVERAGAVMQLRAPGAKLTSTVDFGLPTPLSSPRSSGKRYLAVDQS